MNRARELLEAMDEAKKSKAYFGKSDGFNWAVQIDGVDNKFPTMPFGRRMDDQKKAVEFIKSAKVSHAGAKGKPTMAAVKEHVKEIGAAEFYAKWKPDSAMNKEDSVEVFYKK